MCTSGIEHCFIFPIVASNNFRVDVDIFYVHSDPGTDVCARTRSSLDQTVSIPPPVAVLVAQDRYLQPELANLWLSKQGERVVLHEKCVILRRKGVIEITLRQEPQFLTKAVNHNEPAVRPTYNDEPEKEPDPHVPLVIIKILATTTGAKDSDHTQASHHRLHGFYHKQKPFCWVFVTVFQKIE